MHLMGNHAVLNMKRKEIAGNILCTPRLKVKINPHSPLEMKKTFKCN